MTREYLLGEQNVFDLDAFREYRLSPITAAGYPVKPPKEWFDTKTLGLMKKTPLTVTASGQVYGHIATWDQTHIGLPRAVRPPKSRSDYAFFKTGQLITASGERVDVGQITYAGGHAQLQDEYGEPVSAGVAVQHYDDTASAFADVNVGEDQFGIVVAGALRPNVTDEQLRVIMASAPSGDWRPINGNLEMIAVCQVNAPGFPVARGLAASADGELLALVAAGASDLYRIRQQELLKVDLEATNARVKLLEQRLGGVTAASNKDSHRAKFLRLKMQHLTAGGK